MTCGEWLSSREEREGRITSATSWMIVRELLVMERDNRDEVREFDIQEIADFCGVDRRHIARIERSALAKVREKCVEFADYEKAKGTVRL